MTTYFTLVRHGETDWNAEHRWQGLADVPLNAAGEAQAQSVAEHLQGRGITRIVSSSLARAYRTAELINQRLQLPLSSDDRLREIHVGDVQGLTSSEIAERFPAYFEALKQPHNVNVQFLNGESRVQLGERAANALHDLAERHPGEHILVVTHGGTIRMGLYRLVHLLELPRPLENCSVTRLYYRQNTWHEAGIALPADQVLW